MLRCDGLTEQVTDYLEGQLSLANRVEMYLHLRGCSDCRQHLAQMKATVRWLRQLPPPPSSTEAPASLLARFRRGRLTRPGARRPNGGALRLLVADLNPSSASF